MLLLYRWLFPLTLILLLPYFALQALRFGKYRAGIRQRLGIGYPDLNRLHPLVWVHAVSVGEVLAIEPLVRMLVASRPGLGVVVSTTTATGQEIAIHRLGGLAATFYFPLDLRFTVRRAFDHFRPAIVLLAETEIWPNFIVEAADRRVPLFLVNARLSDRSSLRYRWVRGFFARLINRLEQVITQSKEDAERFIALGCEPERVLIAGNLKFDSEAGENGQPRGAGWLRNRTDGGRPILIAGSTTPGEEELLIGAATRLLKEADLSNLLLVIAPRHPERFNEVARLLGGAGLRFIRRTQEPDANAVRSCQVLLLDTLGELAGVYHDADLVFVGGSLTPYGGHNVLEPARACRPIMVGPYTDNFRAIIQEFHSADALVQLPAGAREEMIESFAEATLKLLRDHKVRRRLGERARACADKHRGATARILARLAPYLDAAQLTRNETAPGPRRSTFHSSSEA